MLSVVIILQMKEMLNQIMQINSVLSTFKDSWLVFQPVDLVGRTFFKNQLVLAILSHFRMLLEAEIKLIHFSIKQYSEFNGIFFFVFFKNCKKRLLSHKKIKTTVPAVSQNLIGVYENQLRTLDFAVRLLRFLLRASVQCI